MTSIKTAETIKGGKENKIRLYYPTCIADHLLFISKCAIHSKWFSYAFFLSFDSVAFIDAIPKSK